MSSTTETPRRQRGARPPEPKARPTTPAATVTSLTDRLRGFDREAPTEPRVVPRPKGRRSVAAAPPGRRSSGFVTLLGLILVLCFIGLVMILSASSVTSLQETGSPWSQFFKQLQWFTLGGIAMVLTMRRDYRRWRKRSGWGVVLVVAMLAAVLVVGTNVNGATRWLGKGSFSIQPAEFAKLALIIFWADLLARRAKWIEHPRLTVIPVMLTFGVIAGLIMAQPNLGTTMVIFAIVLSMLFVAGTPVRWLGIIVALGAAGGGVALAGSEFRRRRLAVAVDPFTDPLNTGYQPLQAQSAIADGGPLGKGLGQSRAKWNFLPEADTDFIYSIIAEETGLLGALVVIALFIALGITGTRIAVKAPDRFGMLLATGITTWFLVQAFLNIGQSVGRIPVVGVPLPFVSSGGSSLVVSMVAAGMLLNIARQTR